MPFSPSHSHRFLASLILVFLGVCPVARPQSTAFPLPTPVPEDVLPGLKEILVKAMEQSPAMIHKNIELAQNEGNFLQSRAQLLPNISTGASYNVSGAAVSANTDVSSTSSGLYYSMSLSQPVFRWGTLKAQMDAAKIQLNIAQKNYAEAYRTLALTLRSQYLGLIAKKLARRNALYTAQQAAAALVVEEDKLSNGSASASQVVQLRLRAEESALQAERVAEDLAQSKRVFQRTAGLAELGDDRIPGEVPATTFDPAAASALLHRFLSQGWEDNLVVQMNRSWLRVSELNYLSAKYRLYPMFGFGASVSQSNSTSASLNSVSQVSVLSQYAGVSMSWSIFDGFATKGAKIAALANKRYYERLLQTVTDQLLDQAMGQERQVGFAARAVKLAQTRADLSDTAVGTIREEAQSGHASRTEVEAAVAVQYQAQLTLMNQRADFLSRWAEFVSTLGHDPVLQQLPAKYYTHAR